MDTNWTPATNTIKLSRYAWQGCSQWFPRADLQAALHFVSGVNAPGEVTGLGWNGQQIGITCGEIRTGLLRMLKTLRRNVSQRLFVDSAAFSEVDFPAGVPTIVAPISDADWQERFRLYRWAAAAFGARAFVVAPDCVAHQAETLERLAKYAGEMRRIAELGASVIVPVQKGALPMAEMFRRELELLGLPAAQVVAGIPMMKDATSLEDLAEFARSLPAGSRVHLLGIGPKARGGKYQAAIAILRSTVAGVRITSDSAVLVSLVGRTNGKGGTPRIVTRCQDVARGWGWDPHAIKDYAIGEWRRSNMTIEDAFEMRRVAIELGLG